jgi:hypothetical protein
VTNWLDVLPGMRLFSLVYTVIPVAKITVALPPTAHCLLDVFLHFQELKDVNFLYFFRCWFSQGYS